MKISFVAMMATALAQLVVVFFTGSAALLADTVHNFGDAMTAIPLGVAFLLASRVANRRFNYGYGRSEDIAGFVIVVTILASAIAAAYASVDRLLHPSPVENLWAVAAASVIGFLGNEGVALFRIRVGREIGSAALVADGYHARADGLTSLAVLGAATGVWSGFTLADPIAGLVISAAIFILLWRSAGTVVGRMMDGVDPGTLDELEHAALHVKGVRELGEIRARWIGHRMRVEMNVAVDGYLTLAEAHEVAVEVRHQVLHHNPLVEDVIVHMDPADRVGERHHRIISHSHDGIPEHSH